MHTIEVPQRDRGPLRRLGKPPPIPINLYHFNLDSWSNIRLAGIV
jgi:hypothetical protein